jgi:hypothetical protein
MRCPLPSMVAVALSSVALGCSASVPLRPVGLPPTPQTVTVKNPGGDAFDPELAALERLSREPWSNRRDRYNTLIVPLADARHWQSVWLWGYPTRAAFRFGDEHYGVVAVWYKPTTEKNDPESCLARFIADARPTAEAYGTRVVAARLVHAEQLRGSVVRPMVMQALDADVDGLFSTRSYAAALAAYTSWPGTCLIQGFMVVAGKHKELAARVRDRWMVEAASRLVWHPRLMDAPGFEER